MSWDGGTWMVIAAPPADTASPDTSIALQVIGARVACRYGWGIRHPDFSGALCHHECMARNQSHRGPAPKDEKLFGPRQLPALRAATQDLCWLLDHGYASHSAIELVGNRHNLTSRQRMAVGRCACSRDAAAQRRR